MREHSLPDVARLRLLDDVARFGSIAAVARASGITASAVSQQLSLLEREAGVQLLERQHRGVILTGAGRVLVEKAGQVVRVLEETRAEMDQLKGELAGRVRIGAIASAAMSIVLPAVDRVRTDHPDIDVRVSAVEPSVSLDDVASGALDIAIIDIYDHVPLALPDHLDVVEIWREPLVLVTPRDADPTRDLLDLKNAAWVMPPATAACGQAVRHACRAEGFEPDVAWETDDLLLLVESVSQGHGVTLLPRLAVAKKMAPISLHELAGNGLHRRILSVARTSNTQRPIISKVLGMLHTSVC